MDRHHDPEPFKKDTWITSMEILPDHPGAIHHIGVLFKPHTPDTVYYKPEWSDIPRDESGSAYPHKKGEAVPFGGSRTQRSEPVLWRQATYPVFPLSITGSMALVN